MQIFYSAEIGQGLCTLDSEESRHAVKVLRLQQGDEIYVTDGHGTLYISRVINANASGCVVEPVAIKESSTVPYKLTIGVAPTKNPARIEWLVEKATEVGVECIQLLQCDHSERPYLKTDRLQRVALSAMKQSMHTWLPLVEPCIALQQWLQSPQIKNFDGLKLIAYCEEDKMRISLFDAIEPRRNAIILIGPEGDFSSDEIALARAQGFKPVSLGPSRLRTETAALYAAVGFNIINDQNEL